MVGVGTSLNALYATFIISGISFDTELSRREFGMWRFFGTRTQNMAFLGLRALVWLAMPSIEGSINNVMTKNFVIGSGICHHSTETMIITVTSLPRHSDGFHGGGGNNVIKIGGEINSLTNVF